jgi:exo-1,4-beta-D-glucosaminidase
MKTTGILTLIGLLASLAVPAIAKGSSAPQNRLDLAGEWAMQSSFLESAAGTDLSQPGWDIKNWHRAQVPTTVLNALTKAGVYPDMRVGLNAYQIPDSSDEFNARQDLAKFSHLPDKRNPWRDPWWFRREFTLPKLPADRHVWLHFNCINYRAEVWLNGVRIADTNTMAGMFQRFDFEITPQAKAGANSLAVKILPVDHPGVPDLQTETLGQDRGYQKDIMKDVTMVMSIGYDCAPTVPDRNMGIIQDVWVGWSGPVTIRHPFVVTELPLPETNRATLRISAELANTTSSAVDGVLRGRIPGTEVKFELPISLGPKETKEVAITPKPVIRNPRLWWPRGYGEQALYSLELVFEVAGKPSDTKTTQFGVRQGGSEVIERNGWHGRRVLINGQKIFCRGGYIQPEVLFDWDARRIETEMRYLAEANLNLIYFEDIPNPPEALLDACDRLGIMFGECFYACGWPRPGTDHPQDLGLLQRCTVDLIKRYRNHPCIVMYMPQNEDDTRREVYEPWRKLVTELDGTRWMIPSAYFPSDRMDVSPWYAQELPSGMTDKGASYSWAEPVQYFNWVRESRNWMFMMEGGSASVPPMSSLARFLPDLQSKNGRFGPDGVWAHHDACNYSKGFNEALIRLHGESENAADYAWKAHLVAADQHRSIFEAVNHRMWDITSGMTQWKINSCWPSVEWQVFDWYLKPMVSWFYLKKAGEPLHVQLNLPDNTVSVINRQLMDVPNLKVFAQVFDLNAKLLWEKNTLLSVQANAYQEAFTVPEPSNATPVYFVKLGLADRIGMISENFYWLRAKGTEDLKALQTLPMAKLKSSCQIETRGAEQVARVKVTNPTSHVAFFVQMALTQGGGAEILPVFWEDNYFSLLPGESREITARFAARDAGGAKPTLEIGGWNVESDFECASLTASPEMIKAGEAFTVTAQISHTFLDGNRVNLRLDGKAGENKWAWARGGQNQNLEFRMQLDGVGKHEIVLGNRKLTLIVKP